MVSVPKKQIKMEVRRADNKGFICYFEDLQDLKNFVGMIYTIIENAKKKALKDEKKSQNRR